METEPKAQHYVPRAYLKRFSVKKKKNYFINAIDKRDLSKIIFPNISNICQEKDLYTLKGDTPEQRQIVERFYSENIENQYEDVYSNLVNNDVVEISPDLHYQIILTVTTMLYRTSKWRHQHNEVRNMALERAFRLCKQYNVESFKVGGSEYSIKGKELIDVQKDFKNREKEFETIIQLEAAIKLAEIRCFDGLMVNKLKSDDILITSDNPVILSNINPGHVLPFDPENLVNLPLDESHILTIFPHSQSSGNHLIIRDLYDKIWSRLKMFSNNSSQLRNCYRYILGQKKGLTQFISNLDHLKKPVSEEQLKKLEEFENFFKNQSGKELI